MTRFEYGEGKCIDLEVGDLIIARYNQGINRDRPFFANVHGINVNRHPIKRGLSLDPAYRLYVDETVGDQGKPEYTLSSSRPSFHWPHHIDDIWEGTPQELAQVLRTEWENLEPWALIMERMELPYNIGLSDIENLLSGV